MVGKTLGHYEILAPLGSGGMGEVYRARDTTLKRDVAVKVLSAEFVEDPERLARLEREARLLASLNHPNIATIHSLERHGDTRFLVLELVQGESLERRLVPGPLTVEKAVDIAKQIAEALEAAHEAGIIHRDLKPANVVVTPGGRAKVLDFGIAKTFEAVATGVGTQATELTVSGTLVGTVPFMSPEQIRGEAIDKRTDVWAFGCVLFEMLTGRGPFARETVADTLSAIIEQQPDWERLPPATPDAVRSLLNRCLQKDAKLRLRDLGDAWVEMNALTTDPSGAITASMPIPGIGPAGVSIRARRPASWLAGGLAAGAAVGTLGMWFAFGSSTEPLRRAEIVVPEDLRISGDIALSPDGLDLVYVADAGGGNALYHHPMSGLIGIPIPGTEAAEDPFFSPDGASVGFFADDDLNTVSLAEGRVLNVCTGCVGAVSGAAWLENDTIVFASTGALFQVRAAGGAPEVLLEPGPDRVPIYSRPSALADGQGVLLEVRPGTGGTSVGVLLVDSEEPRILEENGERPQYSPTGHVVFQRDQTLFAVPVDPRSWQATGQPLPVVDNVPSNYEISHDGTLIHRLTAVISNYVVLVDFGGNPTRLPVARKLYWDVRLSPDQRTLALAGQDHGAGQRIWVYDLDNAATEPQPAHLDGEGRYPVWSPDGSRVAFSWTLEDARNMISWVAPNDPNKVVERLGTASGRPSSFSPDGTVLAFRGGAGGGRDIMLLDVQGDGTPVPLIASSAEEGTPRFSPDGRWLAYTSDYSGRHEVYVTPFPGPPSEHPVSRGGGQNAVWAHDGKTIYYRRGDQMMSVAFDGAGEMPVTGAPELLFEGHYDGAQWDTRARYDIGPEGQGFVMLTAPEEAWPNRINVVFNWFESLKGSEPGGR